MLNSAAAPVSKPMSSSQELIDTVKGKAVFSAKLFGSVYAASWCGYGISKLGTGISKLGNAMTGLGDYLHKGITMQTAASIALTAPVQQLYTHIATQILGEGEPGGLKLRSIQLYTGALAYSTTNWLLNSLLNTINGTPTNTTTPFTQAPDLAAGSGQVGSLFTTYLYNIYGGLLMMQLTLIVGHKLQQYQDASDAETLKAELAHLLTEIEAMKELGTQQQQKEQELLIAKKLVELQQTYAGLKHKVALKRQMIRAGALLDKGQLMLCDDKLDSLKDLVASLLLLKKEQGPSQSYDMLHHTSKAILAHIRARLAQVEGSSEKVASLKEELDKLEAQL